MRLVRQVRCHSRVAGRVDHLHVASVDVDLASRVSVCRSPAEGNAAPNGSQSDILLRTPSLAVHREHSTR
eukprot:2098097-Prymnesium_polylepis.2